MNETEELTAFWTADRKGWASTWVDHYWESDKNPQRDVILAAISQLEGWNSLCEIGAHCGPNLRRIAKAYPAASCAGLDANPDAVSMGNMGMRSEGLQERVGLLEGVFPAATEEWAGGQYDTLLTCFMLAYIAPCDLVGAIRELQRLAAMYVVCVEPNGTGARQISGSHSYYKHDYSAAFRESGNGPCRRYVLEPEIDHLNSVVLWMREQ